MAGKRVQVKPWLVFFGTRVALVSASSEDDAFETFIGKAFPTTDRRRGYLAPPIRAEVNIRPLRASDEGWLSEYRVGASKFLAALKKVG